MKPLTIEQVKALKVHEFVRIVDNENNTTQPPHKTDRIYLIHGNDDTELFVQSIGYSWFNYSTYGHRWLAYEIDKNEVQE